MLSDIKIKICGLKTAAMIDAAADAGTGYFGFNFIGRSPRYVSAAQARALIAAVPAGRASVGLFFDASDDEIASVLDIAPLDIVQLHGSESPTRVAEVKARFGLPVMKALGISGADDVRRLDDFSHVADMLLVDAKAPKGAPLLGGNGVTFDWDLIAGRRWPVPWMLAGGLNADNVGAAITASGATQVDVASGVESAPGVKDAGLIAQFAAAVRA
ncbi:MAG: phosphoribosylanthranilate isomerase [Rhodobacteraceae bacterium]|nr:phosphoribosylanthranilate isomerase [Paracoccaceae bacterium]